MKIENQVCSLEQAKKLNDLGIAQCLSMFFWNKETGKCEYNEGVEKEVWPIYHTHSCFSAFTVAELGLMLPEYIESHRSTEIKGYWYCGSMENEDDWKCCDTQAEAMAAYLLYLIKEEVITIEEINQRLTPNDNNKTIPRL